MDVTHRKIGWRTELGYVPNEVLESPAYKRLRKRYVTSEREGIVTTPRSLKQRLDAPKKRTAKLRHVRHNPWHQAEGYCPGCTTLG